MPYSKKPYINIINLESEVWKDIEGYENYYQVSNMGRIKSLDRYLTSITGRSYFLKSKLMSFTTTDRGYLMVALCKGCITKHLRVNILVAKAFILNPENKKEVNHKKGIKKDNRASELEWCTHKENMQHAHRELGIKMPKGEDSIHTLKFMVKYPNGNIEQAIGVNETASKLGLFASSISLVLNNKQKQTKGFYFYKTA